MPVKKKTRTVKRLPSIMEVRVGLNQITKRKLILIVLTVYKSRAVPKSIKNRIITSIKSGMKKTVKRKAAKRSVKKSKAAIKATRLRNLRKARAARRIR